MDDMTGERAAARLAGLGDRASAAGWPASSTGGVGRRHDTDIARLPVDDRRTMPLDTPGVRVSLYTRRANLKQPVRERTAGTGG